jgi:hypothetical protein
VSHLIRSLALAEQFKARTSFKGSGSEMCDLEAKVSMLEHKIKLLTFLVDEKSEERYPFFMYCLEHDITEVQEKALLKLLSIYNYRYKGVQKNSHDLNKKDIEMKKLMHYFQISLEDAYKEGKPTFGEFQIAAERILGEGVRAGLLLKRLAEQDIYKEISNYLLRSNKDYC